jgi:hypothetical protein
MRATAGTATSEGKYTMNAMLQKFQIEEGGAVTVDWVVLTAAVTALAMLVLLPIAYGTNNASSEVGSFIANQEVGYQNLGN